MNMKKTIAGVMAGAMAVSAMATMVSADQESISLTYDLKKYVEDKNSTKAQIQFVITYANGSADYGFKDGEDSITVGVSDGVWYNQDGSVGGRVAAWFKNSEATLHDVEVSFTSLKNLVADTNPTTVTAKWVSNAANDKNDFAIKGYVPIDLDTQVDGNDWNGDRSRFVIKLNRENIAATAKNGINISGFSNAALGQSKTVSGTTHSFQNGVIKLTYDVPGIVTTTIADGGFTNALGILGVPTTGEKTLNQAELMAGVAVDVTNIKGTPLPLASTNFKPGENGEKVYPLKSTLTQPADVTKALADRKAGGKYYTNPVAVLNDAIANNENVVFEFKSYNGYVATAKSVLFGGTWIDADRAYGWKVNDQDWYNPTFGQHLYTNAGPNGLYNTYSLAGTTEFDMFGSYSSAWAQNLFTGAIVVNSGLTMQLSDTDKFNWGADTLSFDWFTITDEGKVTEAKTFLTKMLLYTPVDWYWDTLTVTVGNLEEDDIIPGEGADGDGDEISDEDGDEIVIDPIEEIDEPVAVDEPVVVTEAPVVTEAVTPVAPVESPKTGNAPVALAVIPVALAAAAVVAKKRD